MNPRRKKRLLITSVVLAGLGVALGLVLYALQQNIDLFYTPGEIVNGKPPSGQKPHPGQRLRVGGLVVPGTVKRAPDSLAVSFDLVDASGPVVTVEYEGILPDLFREGQGIVAQGELVSARRIRAVEVLAKHDEEYMPPEVADALKGMDHFRTDNASLSARGSLE